MPTSIWNFLQPGPWKAFIWLGKVFKCLCTKVMNPYEINPLCTFVVETLCMLEVWFPPAFFDFKTHLIVHLVDELEICGPIFTRWCYLVERYLFVLKRCVHNKAKPKGCMAFGYMYDEAFGFCIEYVECGMKMRKKLIVGKYWLVVEKSKD